MSYLTTEHYPDFLIPTQGDDNEVIQSCRSVWVFNLYEMAQNQRRMIYMKIWSSAQFGLLPDKAKLLYIGSITIADDDGKLIGTPSYLRGQIFPFDSDITVSEVLHLRTLVEESGLFSTYNVNGVDYIEHPKWQEYQIIRRDIYKESTLPLRYETVTESLQKCATSKVKISKDNNTTVIRNILTKWNSLKTASDGKNSTCRKTLLPQCRKITPQIEKAFDKLLNKGLDVDDCLHAIDMYVKEVKNRDPRSDYARHRFSFYEFVKQENGLLKFANR